MANGCEGTPGAWIYARINSIINRIYRLIVINLDRGMRVGEIVNSSVFSWFFWFGDEGERRRMKGTNEVFYLGFGKGAYVTSLAELGINDL